MQRASRQEISSYFNTLACVVKGLEGHYTIIDLRGESCVSGKIIHVDGFMNIDMKDCVYYNSRGDAYPFETFFVKKRNIIYVHIPKGLSARDLAEKQLNQLTFKKPHSNQREKPTFKKKRAEKYQKEIVQEIASTSKS
ncbi:U7 snRNA-associated Sm-like protein LSm10 [Onthophagus taurus]|uniref:U7 snRNA-associated Sm-like protein LSm10 n=1 Tax=Onthophagus taurus TaxID=166361 RepID=UPI000C20BB42|nr:U7 snRNA-associated Sm-like protein LSm10 [Onthophagus taurus]